MSRIEQEYSGNGGLQATPGEQDCGVQSNIQVVASGGSRIDGSRAVMLGEGGMRDVEAGLNDCSFVYEPCFTALP